MILKPMPYEEYAKLPGANWSTVKSLRISPKQYQYDVEHPADDTPTFRIGRCCHARVLEPENLDAHFVCYRDGDRRGKAWEAFKAAHPPPISILNATEYDRAIGAAEAVLAHPIASRYLAAGLREQVVTWADPDTGIACKARVDHAGSHLVDLKTCAEVDPRKFADQAARLGYVGQCVYYRRGLRANGIKVDGTPVLITVESEGPFDVIVYRIPEYEMNAAEAEVSQLLALLKKCRDENRWPGRVDEELELELPAWSRPPKESKEIFMPDGTAVSL